MRCKVLIAVFPITIGILFLNVLAFGQGRQTAAAYYADKITAQQLQQHLSVLASDSLAGRGTADIGMEKAAKYVSSVFAEAGLKPPVNGSYYQELPLIDRNITFTTFKTGDKLFEPGTDYYVVEMSADCKFQANEIILAGYGIIDSASGWNDYKDLNVAGKVVMMFDGEPVDKNGKSLIDKKNKESEWKSNRTEKVNLAMERGAAAVILVHSDYNAYRERVLRRTKSGYFIIDDEEASKKKPVLYITKGTADALLAAGKTNAESYLKGITKKKKPSTNSLSTQVSFKGTAGRTACRNVLGMIEGSDKKSEAIIISAHLDHLGVIDDKIYYGADDDGSGCASILNMAQAFAAAKRDGQGPKRSILFITFSGEEKGLLGSEYYTEHPVFPMEQTLADLNIDMIGRKDTITRPDSIYTYIIGSDKLSTDLHRINETANSSCCELKLDYRYNDPGDKLRLYYRSDHYNFAKKNVPVIFYFTGLHADYHKPTDTIDKIEFNRMVPIAKLVFHTAWELANRDEAIRIDVKQDKP